MFFKKKKTKEYDKENLIPEIHQSICTGEMVIGFLDKRNGKFTEMKLITTNDDLNEFIEEYGITTEIRKIY